MNRLTERFGALKYKKQGALITYFPIGDPRFDTLDLAKVYIENGSDLLEIGLPVLNPCLDGKVIKKSMKRITDEGHDVDWIFGEIYKIRNAYPETPLQIFSYMQIFEQEAVEKFAEFCTEVKADAMLIPDANEEQIRNIEPLFNPEFINLRFMPFRCEQSDIELIKDHAKGYLFLQAVDGATGERDKVDTRLSEKISSVHKQIPQVSVCPGFGISLPQHCRQIMEMGADGVIIGSLLVKTLEYTSLEDTGKLIKTLKNSLI